jgi:iron(III) transport system permease protein
MRVKSFANLRVLSIFDRPENVLMVLMGVVMSIAILGPLVIILLKSLQVQKGLFASVYSIENYLRFVSPRIAKGIVNSFIIAGGSAFLAGVIGVVLAWITARTDIPFRSAFQAMNIIPFFISPLVGGIAWSLLASPKMGMLNKALMGLLGLETAPFNIYSTAGIIWVSSLFHAPFVYLFCIGPFRQMDPALEEAARVSGSSWRMTTCRITLLLASPAILSALILAFVLAIEDLGSVMVLGYPYGIQTISTLIFEGIDQYPPNHNLGAALGILLMSITGFCIILQRRVMASRSFATVTGRGYHPPRVNLGWGRYIALGINLVYLTLAVFLPVATLLLVSFSTAWLGYIDLGQFTTKYYSYIFSTSPLALRGIRNSFILATSAATIAIAIAMVIAYAIHRTRSRMRGWLDFITTIPIAVSGLVMSVGLLVALIRTPIYSTLWILLIAYVIRFFTYGQRSISGVILSLSSDLEESSRVSGGGWFTTMRRILLPLVWPGFVGGWLLLFITYMREVSMSLLLSRGGTETLSVALYGLMIYSPLGAMAAFTMIQVALLFGAAFLFLRLTGSEGIRI